MVIGGKEPGKFKSVHELADRRCDCVDLLIHRFSQGGISGYKACFLRCLCLHTVDPPVQDQRQSASFGFCLGREIADQLSICGKSLSLGAVETPLRREVRVRDDKSSVHDIIANSLDQKALA